jgi:hypothetical protein
MRKIRRTAGVSRLIESHHRLRLAVRQGIAYFHRYTRFSVFDFCGTPNGVH